MDKYYKIGVIYSSLVAIFLSVAFSVVDNYNYKSEWLTAGSVIFLSIIFVIIYSLIISALSVSIFLVKFNRVKSSATLTLLSWFLLPFSFIAVILIHEINFKIKYQMESTNDITYLIIVNLPFIIGLVWSYLKYKKDSSNNFLKS